MMIIESCSKLLEWFSKKESFNLEENFKTLFPSYISDTPEADKASIIGGLEELVTSNLLKKINLNKKDYYLLLRPFNSANQNVQISASTALIIAGIAQKVCDLSNNKDLLIDPLNIKESDILTIITILSSVIQPKESERVE